MGGGGVGVVRGGVHVALLSSPVLAWRLLNKKGEGFSLSEAYEEPAKPAKKPAKKPAR